VVRPSFIFLFPSFLENDINPTDNPTELAEGDMSYVETHNQLRPFVTDEERDTASALQVDHSGGDKSGKYSTFYIDQIPASLLPYFRSYD